MADLRLILLFVTVSALFFSGCENAESAKLAPFGQDPRIAEDIPMTASEYRKQELHAQINRRFQNPVAHYELGQLYQQDGLWIEAEQSYNTALTFDPALRPAQAALVRVLKARGMDEKASLTSRIFINGVSGSAMESLKLALAFQKEQLDDYAMQCYRQALNLAPNSAKIHRQMGFYYLAKGETQMAEEYLTRSFNFDPTQADVAAQLGRMGVEVTTPRGKANPRNLDRIVDDSENSN